MSNLLKLTPENYYTKEANMQYVSVSQYKEFNGTTGKMGCEAYAMAKLRGEVEEVTTTALMVLPYAILLMNVCRMDGKALFGINCNHLLHTEIAEIALETE